MSSIEVLSGALQADANKYIGTTIYNVTETNDACTRITKGFFVWNGTTWVGLGNAKAIDKVLTGDLKSDLQALIDIRDNPANTGHSFDATWAHINVNATTPPNLTGVQFTEVCGEQRVTTLNVSKINLKSLEVKDLTALTALNCSHNQLPVLDVSNNTELTDLQCLENLLPALDVSKNTKLTDLNCPKNQIATLDLSMNTDLKYLRCESNNFGTQIVKILNSFISTAQSTSPGSSNYLFPDKTSTIYEIVF